MNDKVINVYKKCGETPLDCIYRLKKEHPSLGLLPMTYAGRLDPLAEGVLLILIGEECKKKDEYLNLSKEYEVDILFGFATDTYDLMGLILKTKELFDFSWSGPSSFLVRGPEKLNNSEVLKDVLKNFIGKIKQKYPPYSSRPVNGKPLFSWSREGRLDEIEIPTHNVFVESIEIVSNSEISGKDLLKDIKEKISKVKGDFRQKEILLLWHNELKDKLENIYPVIKLRISCGSGVYVRGIANEIGEKLNIGALALKIVRTKVGEYTSK